MKIQKTTFGMYTRAYKLTQGTAEMIVIADRGPRILSLRVAGGGNLLFVDKEAKMGRGAWRITGGHRVWMGPEAEGTYAGDNAPCTVAVKRGALIVEAAVDPKTKLQRVLAISGAGGAFSVKSIVRNTGDMLASGCVWALTCVRPDAKVLIPWGRPGEWNVRKICYWETWGGSQTSNVASTQWKPMGDLFVIDPTGEQGKVGTTGYEGWIGAIFPSENATFVKQFVYQENATYTDEGCAIECYTCAKFIELETLAPMTIIHPGEEACHEERWIVRTGLANPARPALIRKMLR
ncbi:hypothetical protein GX586_03350 [bacterium]|nr:hypothetical protein [bacterium]